jgi:hypothetical protein
MLTKTKLAIAAAATAAVLGAGSVVAQPAFAATAIVRGSMGPMQFEDRSGGGDDWWRIHHHRGFTGASVGFGAGVTVGPAPYYAYDEPSYAYGEPSYTYSEPAYTYTERSYVDNDMDAYCAARFRTYDPVTHTYMGYDGLRHSCP